MMNLPGKATENVYENMRSQRQESKSKKMLPKYGYDEMAFIFLTITW